MTRRTWSAADVECLRLWYAAQETNLIAQVLGRAVHQVTAKARRLGLAKSHELKSAMAARAIADLQHHGRQTQFKPGSKPWSTGTKGLAGVHPGSRRTQFKAGSKPHTVLPLGSLRIVEDTLERKVTELPGAPHLRWKPVSRLVWEAANGPVPERHVVVFKPGMKTTEVELLTLDRVELLTRVELQRRNSIHQLPTALADIARLRGTLTKAINRKTKDLDPA